MTGEQLRDVLLQTRAKSLLDAQGWEAILDEWAEGINRFIEAYRERFGEAVDPLRLFQEDPARAAAFFELDTLRLSTIMKMAVWRILLGCEIVNVEVLVRRGHNRSVRLVLRTPYGEEDRPYESSNPEDIRLIRHLGTLTIDNQPEFQGYYAFAR